MRKSGTDSDRADRPKSYYPVYVADAAVRIPSMTWRGVDETWQILEKPEAGGVAVWPIDPSGNEKVWTCSAERAREEISDIKVERDDAGRIEIYKKYRPHQDGALPGTWWDDPGYSASESGTKVLKELFGGKDFDYPKSVNLVVDCLRVCGTAGFDAVLDYFAGSGTTGHAVINLNREDGGLRKFILVEVADYFDTVLVPRLKKVIFTPEWKNGKPERLATKEEAERTPRLVKVLRLESYEDALHNTFSDDAIGRLADREKAYRDAVGEEEYRIRYLVKLPLEASDSMLNLAKLEHPFDYTLEVLTDHGPKTETVDIVETFNWLYGLRVHRLLTWANKKDKEGKETSGRSYRVDVASDREGKKRVLVVWRDMTGLDPAVERPFLEARAKELGPFEEQWINGDSAAKGFASLDGLFKRLMEEGER